MKYCALSWYVRALHPSLCAETQPGPLVEEPGEGREPVGGWQAHLGGTAHTSDGTTTRARPRGLCRGPGNRTARGLELTRLAQKLVCPLRPL